MKVYSCTSTRPLTGQLFFVCMLLSLWACTNKVALRDKERAHYDNLESELLNEQKAKDRRLRDEYRVGPDIQPSDSVKLPTTEQNKKNESSSIENTESEPVETSENADFIESSTVTDDNGLEAIEPSDANPAPELSSSVVTQIVVGQSSENDTERNWTRKNYPSPVDGLPLCAVVSIPVVVQNGELDTQVSVVVSTDTVFLRTDATFDTEALNTGFQIDAGFPIPFDHYLNELTAVIDENHPIVLNGLKNGTTLSVSFAYDPQVSSADTHVVELTLDSFAAAWSEMSECVAQMDG